MTTKQTNQTKYPEPVRIAKAWKLCQQGWSLETIRQLLELSPHNPKLFAIECVERVKHIYNNSDFVKEHPRHAEAANNAIKAAKGNNEKEQQKAAHAGADAAHRAYYAYHSAVAAHRAAYYTTCVIDATTCVIDAAYHAAYAAHYTAYAAYYAALADPSQKAWQLQRLMVYMLDEMPS